ncbi:MAG: alpha-hydroxy-acid oxidizing protein [Acidobacteria bacterium]|nr:alpha-hydroxy-acid oxidizing protein [Acidobacteriota bacterium]
MNLSYAINVSDLRRMAASRLPKVVFDYLDGGAEDEVTLNANCRSFETLNFRPRSAVAFDTCDLRTQVLGFDLSFPAILAPIGYSRMMHRDGEVAAAGAAGAAGTAYILSTISGHRLEDVKAASSGPVWFQLYLVGGREASEAALARAQAAGYSALVVTVDTAVAGMRERDYRNGMKQLMGRNPFLKVPHLWQMLSRPGWLTSYLLDGGLRPLPNVVIPGKGQMTLQDVGSALARAAVTWEDFRWIREVWKGPIVVKGVQIGDDARRAVDMGAAAVIVSNHGGRQLDSVAPSLRILPEVVTAVNGQIEVLMDGGVRRGGDIVKALCLGARAVLLGRAYAYGMAAAGRPGATRAIEILRADMERTMRLLGCSSVQQLNSSYIEAAAIAPVVA